MEKIIKSPLIAIIFHELFQHQTCIRCIFRFLKIENLELYRSCATYIDILHKVSEMLSLEKSLIENYDFTNYIHTKNLHEFKDNKCVVCLGILQSLDKKHTMQYIMERIKQEDFEFKDFKFTIKIPLSCSIRYTQMAYFVSQQMTKNNKISADDLIEANNYLAPRETLEIKTVYKWILSPIIAEAYSCKASQDANFIINFTYKNDDLEQKEFLGYGKILEKVNEDEVKEKIEKKKKVNPHYIAPKNNFKIEPTNSNQERICMLPKEIFMSVKCDQNGLYIPPELSIPNFSLALDLNFSSGTIYVMGNYLKYVRDLSQTPWEIDGKKLYASSIEEEIAKVIQPYFKSRSYKFHSGGREDIDVRMLGSGRPFSLELIDPKRISISEIQIKKMEETINISPEVNVRDLSLTDNTIFDKLKQSESEKIKAYCCIVYSKKRLDLIDKENLEKLQDIKISQKTPIRVLHRRTLMIRQKIIHKLQAQLINEHYMILYVLASAGTYIKEFIHGDLERTLPNLGTILKTECDILQLDVIKLYEKYDPSIIDDFMKIKP